MKIAVIIPCFKVTKTITSVLDKIPAEVTSIYVVDDGCPDHSGDFVKMHTSDHRIKILHNPMNMGVGGAVIAGYKAAIADGMDILVKIDGDNQMDPSLIPAFIEPIVRGEADYTKGNRFFEIETVRSMPVVRLIGNIALSFMTKLSSGYWNLFDPTNGYTAIHSLVAARIPLNKVSNRYFFESDMLFRLNTLQAVVIDIPMHSHYDNEKSNLVIHRQIPTFLINNIKNTAKRIYYNYLLRNFNYASIELIIGLSFLIFGILFGSGAWIDSSHDAKLASAGTVMLASLPIIIGTQLLMGFTQADMSNIPTNPLQKRLHHDARHPYI